MISALFVLAGVAVGAFHAKMIARAMRPRRVNASLSVRVGMVAVVLVVAARAGHLVAAAAGWAAGFAAGTIATHRGAQ